jgi:hypothetical protein
MIYGAGILSAIVLCGTLKEPRLVAACFVAHAAATFAATAYCESKCEEEENEEQPLSCR